MKQLSEIDEELSEIYVTIEHLLNRTNLRLVEAEIAREVSARREVSAQGDRGCTEMVGR